MADAHRLGAQDIVAKPFSNDELLAHVQGAARQAAARGDRERGHAGGGARGAAAAAPAQGRGHRDLRGPLRRPARRGARPGPAETQRIPVPPRPAPLRSPAARAAAATSAADEAVATRVVERHARRALWTRGAESARRPARSTGEVSVDKLLEDTLSGLEVGKPKARRTARARGRRHEPRGRRRRPPSRRPAAPRRRRRRRRPPRVTAPSRAHPGPLPGGTPFGQYELIEPIATGGHGRGLPGPHARRRGVPEDRRHQAHPPAPDGQRRVRHDVRRRGQAGGAAPAPQHHPHLRPRQDRAFLLHRDGVHRRQGPALDPAHARGEASRACRSASPCSSRPASPPPSTTPTARSDLQGRRWPSCTATCRRRTS